MPKIRLAKTTMTPSIGLRRFQKNTWVSPGQRSDKSAVEERKLEIEDEKLKLENEKLSLERSKLKWTILGITFPLTIAALGFGFNVWSQDQKARDDFALKVAEIVMATDDPTVTQNKAATLVALFPDRLPSDLAGRINPADFGGNPIEQQRELLKLVASHSETTAQTIRAWKAMFPDDAWVSAFEKALRSSHTALPKRDVRSTRIPSNKLPRE